MNLTKSRNSLLFLLIAGISISLLQACSKIKEATTFKIKYDLPDMNYTIDSVSLLKSEIALFSKSSSINIDSIAGSQNGLVEHVSFYKMRFSVVSPESAKLDWLNSARITITPFEGSPVDIATSGTINATENFIDFQVTDFDLASAMKKPFLLTVYGNLNGTVPDLPMEMLMESGLEITICPF